MKRHLLDIAILGCLILVIILLVILIWPEEENIKNNVPKNDVKTSEASKENKTDINTENLSATLFTDTTKTNKEEEVISYIEQVETQVNAIAVSKETSNNKTVKETLEDTFITITDFIFYNGTIKGITFQELTDSAKEKVLNSYERIDRTIEKKFPNYKENIKSTANKGYTMVVEKAHELKESIISKYKEKVGEEEYNNVVGDFEEDKNRFQEAYTPYVEKGKEVLDNTISKLDTWYQGFKESRE